MTLLLLDLPLEGSSPISTTICQPSLQYMSVREKHFISKLSHSTPGSQNVYVHFVMQNASTPSLRVYKFLTAPTLFKIPSLMFLLRFNILCNINHMSSEDTVTHSSYTYFKRKNGGLERGIGKKARSKPGRTLNLIAQCPTLATVITFKELGQLWPVVFSIVYPKVSFLGCLCSLPEASSGRWSIFWTSLTSVVSSASFTHCWGTCTNPHPAPCLLMS